MAGDVGDRTRCPHPTDLEQFLRSELPPPEAKQVLVHLLRGCARCRSQMSPLAAVLFHPERVPEAPVQVGSEYEFPLFKAHANARKRAAAMASERQETLRDREDRPLREVPRPDSRDERARSSRDWERCEALLARSFELRFTDPEGMLAAGAMALSLAERIDPGFRGPLALADLNARAWAARGNARRVLGDLADSESDLARALERAADGSGDPRLLAEILDFVASLRIAQRSFDEALKLLDWVFSIHWEMGDRHQAGRTLVVKSNAASYALDLDEAMRLLSEALPLIEADRDPHLVLTVVHNLIHHLVDRERFQDAQRLLRESRPLYEAYGGRIDRTKSAWVEGRIAAGLGDPGRAARIFAKVRMSLAEIGLPYDMALVSLELAALWLEEGRSREIKALLDDTVEVFRARGIRREAIASLLMLRESIQREQATKALLRTVAAELERLESEPLRRAAAV